jgi:hypothetical protein
MGWSANQKKKVVPRILKLSAHANCHELVIQKPFSFNSFEKAVPIQPSRKSRPHSTHLKKPSSFNPVEKVVPSQPI